MISISTEKALELLTQLGVDTKTLPDCTQQTMLDAAIKVIATSIKDLEERVEALEGAGE